MDQVEQDLLQATNAILPSSSSSQQQQQQPALHQEEDAEEDRMTMSEVAQVLQDLTALYSKQQERLEQAARSLLNYDNNNRDTTATAPGDNNHMAATTLTANTNGTGVVAALFNKNLEDVEMIAIAPGFDYDNNDSPASNRNGAATTAATTPVIAGLPPLYWCIGPTLSAVAETDHETDGTTTVGSTTPASSIFVSPAMMMTQNNSTLKKSASGGSNASRRRRRHGSLSSSHGTPATPTVPLLSAWTTSVLEQEEHEQQQQQHSTTTPTNNNNNDNAEMLSASRRKEPSSGQKRQDDFLRLELQLRRDIHKALHHPHSRNEDDNNHDDEYNSHVIVAQPQQDIIDYAADYDDDDDDESDDGDDDDDTDDYDFDESMDTDMYTVDTDTSTIVAADRMLQCFAPKPSRAAKGRPEKKSVMEQHDDDEEEDEDDYNNDDNVDDSALYCATVLAEDRRRPVATTTATAGQKIVQHQRLTKSSTFPSEIITTNNNHHRHYYRSTNHGKNQNHHNSSKQQLSLTAATTNLAMEDMTSLVSLVTVSEKGKKNNKCDGGGGYEMDEAASQVSEAASEETPVLDRYRLDFDEESPNGFRVVPNQRRRHRQHHQQQQHVKPQHVIVANNRNNTTEQKQVAAPAESNAPRADERKDTTHEKEGRRARFSVSSSPLSCHAAAAATTPRSGRRHYNKTSSLAKQKRMPSTPTIDENSPLLLVVDNNPATLASPQQTMPAGIVRSPLSNIPDQLEHATSISSPSSAGGGGNLTNKSLLQQFNRPLPPSLLYAQTQLATIQNDDSDSPPNSAERHYHSRSLKPPTSLQDSSPKGNSATKMVAKNKQSPPPLEIVSISQSEYDTAPRVVQMQVRYDEVQAVTAALNKFLQRRRQHDGTTTLTTPPMELGEDDIKQLLKPLGLADRKSKSILMSLCHWRRLVMRRREEGVFFAISLE